MTDPEPQAEPTPPSKPKQCTRCFRLPIVWRGLDLIWFVSCCIHDHGVETTDLGTRDEAVEMWNEGVEERRRLKEKVKEAAEKRKKAKRRRRARKLREAKKRAELIEMCQ
jgi:hypothetical protein